MRPGTRACKLVLPGKSSLWPHGDVGTISWDRARRPPSRRPHPPPGRTETLGSGGALTDPDDVGHPARVRDPEGAHEEPGPVFPNQTPEAPPGSGHRWAPPCVPGARPRGAPWGGSSRRGREAAPEAPPGPAARLPSAAASGGRPAAPRTSYWGATPRASAPPRPAAAHGPPASAAPPGLLSDRAAARVGPAALGCAPARAATCPGCRAPAGEGRTRLRPLLLPPPPMLSPGLAQSPGVELHARTHSLPAPSPAPCLPPPASRPRRRRRPRPLRALPRAHALHTHARRGHTRALTPARGGGAGDPRRGLGRRPENEASPPRFAPPPRVSPTARARCSGAGRAARALAPRLEGGRWRRARREPREPEPAVCGAAPGGSHFAGSGGPGSLPDPIPRGSRVRAAARRHNPKGIVQADQGS